MLVVTLAVFPHSLGILGNDTVGLFKLICELSEGTHVKSIFLLGHHVVPPGGTGIEPVGVGDVFVILTFTVSTPLDVHISEVLGVGEGE